MRKRITSVVPKIILCITLTGAACTDLTKRRVPNLLLLPGLFAGLTLRGTGFFRAAILIFFPVYFLFRIKVMGAGDGKILMLIAGSLDLSDAFKAIFFGFLIAALISVFRIISKKNCRGRLLRLFLAAEVLLRAGSASGSAWDGLREHENSVPLAACLAAGTIPVILFSIFIP